MGRILLLILIPLMYYCAIKGMKDWKNYENLLTNWSRGSIITIEREVRKMKTYINCYYCNFYIEDTCECELGYFDDSECGEDEEEENV